RPDHESTSPDRSFDRVRFGPAVGPMACAVAGRLVHCCCVPPGAAKPVSDLGRSAELPQQPPLSGTRVDTPLLDVDHISYGSLYSSDVDDLGPGLLGLGHEPLRLPSHQPPVACRECGGVLLPGPSARDVSPAGAFCTRSGPGL